MKTINYNYDHLSQAEFIKKVNFIIFSCSGNPNFLAFPANITDIITKLGNYTDKLAKAAQGDHVAVQEARAIRTDISTMLKLNGIYINQTANGDVAKLESSGYDLTKERIITPKPEVQVQQSDQSGAGKIIIKVQDDAVTYLVFHAPDPMPDPTDETKWTRLPMTTKHYLWITGVDPGKDHWLMYCTATIGGETSMRGPFKFRLL